MDIAVLGTGSVGRTIAARLHELGHTVTIGTRDPEATRARADHPAQPLATYADAAAGAELVVLAVAGTAALDVLALGTAEFNLKVVR
jgi:3-hydroxyisobutyrate dehydrogenase-like beta-hydroxyacid dehydrogenase